jgi:hypothetical protein
MTTKKSLAEVVAEIGDKATREENAEQIDQKVTIAQTFISRLNSDLETLASDVADLQFYREVLDGAFGINPPGDKSIRKARDAVSKEQNDIVQTLISDGIEVDNEEMNEGTPVGAEFDAYRKEIRSAQDAVEDDIEKAKSRLRDTKSDWLDKIESAEGLLDIIGGTNDKFANTVSWMRKLITQKIFNTGNSATSVVKEWGRAKAQWEEGEGFHGLDAFQSEHGLSDETMDAIERLSQHNSLTLENLDIDVLREMKSVKRLSEEVEIQI